MTKLVKQKGITIIEGLVLLAVFSIITMTFYEAFALSTNHIINAKRRLLAVNIANEKMEILRGLQYADVAVSGGVPNGSLDPDETLSISGGQFRVQTSIGFVDDPDDGTLASGTDPVPNDYKLAVVRVSWGAQGPTEEVSLRSYFVPTGLETDAGGGILSVNVIDAAGMPVPNASVRIQNSTVTPTVDTTLVTGTNGNVALVGAAASSQKYVVTVTKAGYETVITRPPYPTTAYYPVDVHLTAINDSFTTGIIISSSLADLTIESVNPLGEPVPDVNFDMTGGRVLGTTMGLAPVYEYSSSLVTGGTGNKSIVDLSPGMYQLLVNESGYTFWKVDYGSTNDRNSLVLGPSANLTVSLVVINQNIPGYFVKVLDGDTGDPVSAAKVKLENIGLSYSVEKDTDLYGYAYIPGAVSENLVNGETYDVTVTHADYATETSSVTVNNLMSDTINMSPL